MNEQGMQLSADQAEALALRLVARRLDEYEEWLLWEDVPTLSEASFELLLEYVRGAAEMARESSHSFDRSSGIDSAWLSEEALNGPTRYGEVNRS